MSANWSKFDIEKFDGTSSFALWQIRMKAILTNMGVKAALTGRPKELEGADNDRKWEVMEDKALSTIQLCLSDCTLQEILTETKAADAWAKLEKTYMQKTVTNRLRLKQRFHSLRMTEGTPLKSHISEYTALLNDMERIGIKTDDEDKAMVLLCSLPNSYKVFKETILHSRDSLTFDDVKNNLLIKSDIDLDSTKAGSSHQDVGLFVERGRQKEKSHHINKSRSRSKHRNLTCNYCKKMGHIKADCFKLKNKQ